MKSLPTTERGRRSRAAILDTAAQMMHAQGIAATSMDDVLAASGAGKSQLYHYFENKQDLCAAVLHHQFDQVLAAQPSLGDPECVDVGRWRDQVLTAFRTSRVGTCPLGSFVGQTDRDPLLHETLAALFARWQDALADLVRRSQAAGRVRADADPAQAGTVLLGALQGGTVLAHMWRSEAPLASALDAVIDPLAAQPPAKKSR
jgi:TetR/AcrR family transcriptional regulator, transcriptional repressor for nem operon